MFLLISKLAWSSKLTRWINTNSPWETNPKFHYFQEIDYSLAKGRTPSIQTWKLPLYRGEFISFTIKYYKKNAHAITKTMCKYHLLAHGTN